MNHDLPNESRWLNVDGVRPAAYNDADPRSILEQEEARSPDLVDKTEVGAALGRILAWMLDARTSAQIGMRVKVAASKIRPELIGGQSMRQIGEATRVSRFRVFKLAKDFEQTFGVGGLNDRSAASRRRMATAYARKHPRHPGANVRRQTHSHLAGINRLCLWLRAVDNGTAVPASAAQLAADFRPLLAYLASIGLELPPAKESIRGPVSHR